MSFLTDYFGIVDNKTEQPVCCPFPHYTSKGLAYKESRPSAYVNTVNNLFYCHACGTGKNEVNFIKSILGCSLIDARKIQQYYNTEENLHTWQKDITTSNDTKELINKLGITPEVAKELNLGTAVNLTSKHILFPVFMYNHLMDIRVYQPEKKPKVMSRQGALSGLIIPFDVWVDNPKHTLLCAGEKDMAIARSYGFNAITLTGGEQSLPKTPEVFRDKYVYIVYDNDSTGIKGAQKIANVLADYAKEVRVITNFHETCKEKGEDLYDYFTKYKKTRKDLIECIKNTPVYQKTEIESDLPLTDLYTASQPENLNKLMRSNIQVVAVYDTTFTATTAAYAEKFKLDDNADNILKLNETRDWELTERNLGDLLHIIDNNFKETDIDKNIKNLMKIPLKEKYIVLHKLQQNTVYKANVTDLFETSSNNIQPMEYVTYSLGHKLESGKKYTATYKIVPHPYKGQTLIMIITDLKQASDSVTNFTIGLKEKENLQVIQNMTGSIEERMNKLAEKVKGVLGYNGNTQLIQIIDLTYHTALTFNLGSFKAERGYLDTLIVGESRVGKSSTANALRQLYKLGTFVSLAGTSATIPGIIGGSYKTAGGSFQTRAGVIPQNHKGLIIFEEFGKCEKNITANLTDIRSSNEVRISRVSGTVTMPAMVRMLSLTNVKNVDGMIKPIAAYPDGISIVQELVDTAEDIARYDLILVLSDTGNTQIDPLWEPEEPFKDEVYQTRIRWIWSRTAEQIQISKDVARHIIDRANELNRQYESHIKIFGTECWKKLTRLAIAIAGYLVSTDETYENIVLTKEHIDYAEKLLIQIYDNSTFRLKEYVENEKRYSQIDEEGVKLLQDIFNQAPGLLLELERQSSVSRNMLFASAGLSQEELGRVLNRLARGMFIRYTSNNINPTQRFRIGIAKINKKTQINRCGEL